MAVNSNAGAEEKVWKTKKTISKCWSLDGVTITAKDFEEALAECKTTKLKRGWFKDPKHAANSTRDYGLSLLTPGWLPRALTSNNYK